MQFLLKIIRNYLNSKIYFYNIVVCSLYIFISILFGFYMFKYENLSFIDTVYYLITTSTSVGYGDISPKQDLGKIFAVIYMIISIGTLSILIGVIIEKLISVVENKKKGTLKMKNESNLIIVGYPNEDKIKKIVNEIRGVNQDRIIIVTNKLEVIPTWFANSNITFIKGHISNKDTLDRSNINETNTILVLTEENNEQSDDSAITTALFIKSLKKESTRLIIELNNTDNLIENLFKEDIITQISSPFVLAQEVLNEGAISFSNAVFQNTIKGTQLNIIYLGEETNWSKIAFKLIENGLIPEAYKDPSFKDFDFLPKPNAIIKTGFIIKYRGETKLTEL